MDISDYPSAIAKKEEERLLYEKGIREILEFLNSAYAEVDRAIAFGFTDLKNEGQRKAKRQELIDEREDIGQANQDLQKAKDSQALLDIELGLLRNQFSVLKLQLREKIAILEAQAE